MSPKEHIRTSMHKQEQTHTHTHTHAHTHSHTQSTVILRDSLSTLKNMSPKCNSLYLVRAHFSKLSNQFQAPKAQGPVSNHETVNPMNIQTSHNTLYSCDIGHSAHTSGFDMDPPIPWQRPIPTTSISHAQSVTVVLLGKHRWPDRWGCI